MGRARIDEMCIAKLLDPAKTLERRTVDNVGLEPGEVDVSVDGIRHRLCGLEQVLRDIPWLRFALLGCQPPLWHSPSILKRTRTLARATHEYVRLHLRSHPVGS